MKEENELVCVFTGNQAQVILIKEVLEDNDIFSVVQNDFQSGVMAGFSGGLPTTIDLFIKKKDFMKAKAIIEKII